MDSLISILLDVAMHGTFAGQAAILTEHELAFSLAASALS
jgi:hypothetical protein